MSNRPDVTTLATDALLREAIPIHQAIHGEPETVWEDFLFRHPRWAAPGAHRAILDRGRIVALTSRAMYHHRIGDTTLPAGEIGLVGTLPEHRNRGLSRRLMESWLDTMREEFVRLSFLVGIPGYYERWDYHYAVPDQVSHRLAITHDALAACAGDAVDRSRSLDPDRDVAAVVDLINAEHASIPCSPVWDESFLRFFVDRAHAHGVDWRVVEIDGEVAGVIRVKRWGEGIGPQAPGAVTLAAACGDHARIAVAAALLAHLRDVNQPELPLAIAPHSPIAEWLYQRGASRKSDRSVYPGGYAAMVRVNDLTAVLVALRGVWDVVAIAKRFAGTAITLRAGQDAAQIATIAVSEAGVAIEPSAGGIEIGAPPAVTVPWVTGWRSAADWIDGTPYPPLPGPMFDLGDPATLPPKVRGLLRELFPARHPYIGDTTQGA